MSSTNDIRERRRLKILNQSEERIKKLLGTSNHQVSDRPAVVGSCVHTKKSEEHIAEHNAEHDFLTEQPLAQVLESFSEDFQNSISVSNHNRIPSINSLSSESADGELKEVDNELSIPDNKRQSNYWLVRNILLMLVGVVVRLLLVSQFGRWIIQTVFNPFMTIEVIIFGFERTIGKNWQEDVSGGLGGMWLTVFHLTGVGPDVIQTYRRVMALLLSVLTDFMFYFFAFIVTHLMIDPTDVIAASS